MENTDYVKNALNTEPQDYSPIVERMQDPSLLWELLECLYSMKQVGERLDVIKRAIFYGKDHDFHYYGDEMLENFGDNAECHLIRSQLDQLSKNVVTTEFARLIHSALGLSTEAGEFVEALLDHVDGADLDLVNLSEELGDVCWYVAIGSDTVKVPLSEIQQTNINKLKARFPDKFSEEKAINRDLDKEREILES